MTSYDDLAHLRRAKDFMDREYARPLNVPELARRGGFRTGYDEPTLRARFGLERPPSRYAATDRTTVGA